MLVSFVEGVGGKKHGLERKRRTARVSQSG